MIPDGQPIGVLDTSNATLTDIEHAFQAKIAGWVYTGMTFVMYNVVTG